MIAAGSSRCPACGAEARRVYAPFDDWLQRAGSFGGPRADHAATIAGDERLRGEHFMRCDGCGSFQVAPLPTSAALAAFYQDYGASGGYGAKAAKKLKRAGRRIRRLRWKGASGRFLDVGCNLGFAVEAARLQGFAASGLELDEVAVAAARERFPRNDFRAGTVETLADETGFAGSFGLIYCSEVIEHVTDIEGFARALAVLARPGGLLYLTTPDAGHPRRPRDFLAWDEVKPPEHLTWFTRRGLAALLKRSGFDGVEFQWNWKPGLRALARRA